MPDMLCGPSITERSVQQVPKGNRRGINFHDWSARANFICPSEYALKTSYAPVPLRTIHFGEVEQNVKLIAANPYMQNKSEVLNNPRNAHRIDGEDLRRELGALLAANQSGSGRL